MFCTLWLWYRYVHFELGPHVVVAEPLAVKYIDARAQRNQNEMDSAKKQKESGGDQQKCSSAQKIEYTFLVKEGLFGSYRENDFFSFELSLTPNCNPSREININKGQEYLMVFDRPSAGPYRLVNAAPVKQSCDVLSEYVLTHPQTLSTLEATGLIVGEVCVFSRKSKRRYESGVKLDLIRTHLDLLSAMQPQRYLSNIFNFDLKSAEEGDAEKTSDKR